MSGSTVSDPEDGFHWTGLPEPAFRFALWAFLLVMGADLLGQLLIVFLRTPESLVQGPALNAWDFSKAIATALLLAWTARSAKNRNMAAFAVVYLLVGLEDQIRLHLVAARIIGGLIDSMNIAHGQRSNQIGEFVALTGLAVVGAAAVWGWRRPALRSLRRSRIILGVLLVMLFLLTAVLNFADQILGTSWLSILEEVGERLVMTVGLAYAAGLATVKDWWAQP